MVDMPSVYGLKIRKARKPHRCCECRREIERGEKYYYHHGVWNGKGASYHQCDQCGNLAQMIANEMSGHWNSDEGIEFGGLKWSALEYGFGDEWKKIAAHAGGEK